MSPKKKGIEIALADGVHRFKALTAMSSDWYWEQDVDFRFTQVHTGADLGVDVPIGRTRWEPDTFGVSAKHWDAHRQVLREHKPFRDFEFGRHGLDGSPLWFSISGDPSFDSEGRFTGYFGVGRNKIGRASCRERVSYSV